TARRQWERIVWVGGARDECSSDAFCDLQLESIATRERLGLLEPGIYSDLKSAFTRAQDFDAMKTVTLNVANEVERRRGNPEDVRSARAFLKWLTEDNYIFLGTVRYRLRPDDRVVRVDESATGVFTDETLLPVVFP